MMISPEKRKLLSKRFTASCVTLVLVITQVFSPSVSQAFPLASLSPSFQSADIFSKLQVPKSFGMVEEQFEGKSNGFVFFIQDAHTNPSAQKSIASIVDLLAGQFDISLLGQEGAEEKIDTALLRAFPIREATKEVMERYLSHGVIGGPEYLAVTSERNFHFFGVDKRKLYLKNLSEFLSVMDVRDRGLAFVRATRRAMKNLQNSVYSKPHRELNELVTRYQSGQIDLLSFISKLKKIADESKVDTSMFSTLALVAGISADTQAETIKGLDAQHLFGEIEELSYVLKEHTTRSPMEEKLIRLEEYLLLMEHGLNLELVRKDAARLKNIHQEFTRENISQFLTESSKTHSLKLVLGEDFNNPIDDYHSLIIGFYVTAGKRDQILAEQLLKEMHGEKKDMAVLVTGGFHKEGITRKLRGKGISYAVISPSISEVTARDTYLAIMKNSRLLLDNPSRNTLGAPIPEGFPEIRRPFLNAATSEIVDVSRSRSLLRQYGVDDPSLLPQFVSDSFRQKGINVFSGFGIAATDDDLVRAADRWDRRLSNDLGATVEDMRESLVAAVRGTASAIPEILSGEKMIDRGVGSESEESVEKSGAGFGRRVHVSGQAIVAGIQIIAWLFFGPKPERRVDWSGAMALLLNAILFLPATTGVFFLGSYSYTPKLEAILDDPHGYLAAEWGGVPLLKNEGNIESALQAAEKSLELDDEGHYDLDDNWVHEYYYIMPEESRSILADASDRLRGIDFTEAKLVTEDPSFEYAKEGNGRMVQDLERIERSVPSASNDSGEYRTKKTGWFSTTDEFEESRVQLKQMAAEAKERGMKHYALVPPTLRSDFEQGRLNYVLSWIWYIAHIVATFTLWRTGYYHAAGDWLRSGRGKPQTDFDDGDVSENDRPTHSTGFGVVTYDKESEEQVKDIRIAMAQVNVKVGDLEGNFNKIVDYIRRAEDEDADIVVFPELALLGYPPEDLVLQPHVITNNIKWRDALISQVGNITAIVGFVDRDSEGNLYNAQAIISNGELKGVYHKQDLPNYGVFDEQRYFTPGKGNQIFDLNGVPLCINICEDIWNKEPGVYRKQAEMGARLLINTSASPFRLGVENERLEILHRGVKETGATFVYANLVGGQDELVFDGGSFVMAPDGQILAEGNRFEEDLIVTDVRLKVPENLAAPNDIVSLVGSKPKEEKKPISPREAENLPDEEIIYRALVLGIRDYMKKNGFDKAVIGISGGIDSALVAAIAVDAVGKENVVGISMPTRYNTEGTKEDARLLAQRLGIKFFESSIQIIFSVFLSVVINFIVRKLEQLGWKKKGEVSEENLQARIRGAMLMFISNFFGVLVLSTGNKSELAVGYATLYGDMAGGFSPIKDLPKTKVFKLARYINARSGQERIPVSTIERPPSAELRKGQRDTDALPPYEILDPILEAYIEKKQSIEEMSKTWDRATVERVVRLVVKTGEHKRRQAPPGPKITSRSFGKDWRMPITNGYDETRTPDARKVDETLTVDSSANTGFGVESSRIAKDLEYIARLNQERPEGYPVRSFENPPVYTDDDVIARAKSRTNPLGWAHPNLENPELSEPDRNRMREEIRADIKRFAPHTKFVNGMPKNRRESGMKGRGLLGRYGPNPAEDPVVLRYNENGELEVLTIERGDGVAGRALPGGMDRWGDETKVGVTATRELYEETGIRLDLTEGMVVYEGPVDDWRDTNDAWIESRAVATLLSWEESKYLKPDARSDAKKDSAKWVKVNDPGNKFYARHGIIIANAVAKVMSGQLTSAEAKVMKKYPPLDITTRSLEEAYQAFRENRHQKEVYDLIAPVAPHGGNYLVAAGLEETLGAIRRRRFSKAHIQQLRKTGRFSEKFLKYLSEFIFEGDIDALQEGRVVSPDIPLLRISASPVEIALLKDLIINRMAFSTNIATKTARIAQAANGEFVDEESVARLIKEFRMTREQIKRFRAVLDFGQRRAQGRGATEASRAAVVGGAIATSNVKAAKMHYLEPSGTMAHFFIMLFPPDREIDAFRLYAKAFPHQTTLLVDTYDTIQGVRNAITVAKEMAERGEKLFGVRLDSGNLATLSREVRKMLNEAGLYYVKIFASDDLDEAKITKLLSEGAELDGLGVGTNLITGGKQAYLDLKFVESKGERIWRSRHKGKIQRYIKTQPGRTAHAAYAEEIFELLTPIWRGGERVFGVEKPWQAHLRTIEELNQWSPNQKKLEGSVPIPIEVQDNPLSINPETDAVLDVDVSTTFMPGGGLPVREGDLILPNVRTIGNLFPKKRRFASVDRHPRGHMSLASSFEGYASYTYLTYDEVSKWTDDDQKLAPHVLFTLAELKEALKVKGGQMLWPDHAEEGTEEGELHHQFLEREYAYVQVKGMDPRKDSYSAFRDNMGNPTKLAQELHARGVKRLFVTGLAMDYCVGWSCEDAVKEGFEVFIIIDATASVGFPEGSIDRMKESFRDKGIKVITTKELVDANNHMGVFPSGMLPEPIAHPPVPEEDESSALEEDMYHLTMAQVLFSEGLHEKPAIYDYFFRTPPYGDDKIIVSGVKFLMDEIRKFKFTAEDIEYLRKYTPYKFSDAFLDYLAHFEFKGDLDTLPEGSVAFAREPIIRVKGTALEIIIETLLLKRINFNNLMATWSNITRQTHGENVRLNIDAVAGAQGQSHAEAMYSAFVGGSNATTDIDAHLNYGIPLAWPDDEGEWLGSDFITGGPKSALGGVYKLAEFDGEARIKLSDNPAKTSLPGEKEIVEIKDLTGNVIRRFIKLQGEELQLNPGETAVSLLVPAIQQGKIVYTPPSIWETQVFRRDQVRRYAGIHESVLSEGLSRRQNELIEQARSAVRAATEVSGFGVESSGGGGVLKTTDGFWMQLDQIIPIAEEAERLSLAAIEELKGLIKTQSAEYDSIPATGDADSVLARTQAHSRLVRSVALNVALAGLAENSRMLLNAFRNAHPVTRAYIFS